MRRAARAALRCDQVARSCDRATCSPATRPAAAAAVATSPTTAATATGALLRLVDAQRAAAHVLPVEALDGARGIRVRHLDKAEATGTTRVTVIDQGHRLHLA